MDHVNACLRAEYDGSATHPSRRTFLFGALALTAATSLRAQPAATGDYPRRAVRIVVPFPPGGATDLTARVLAARLTETWGQSVVVENRPGASGMIGAQEVLRAPADGYTIMVSITTHIQNPSLFRKMPYDWRRDFSPVSQTVLSYLALAVRADYPASNLQEFVAHVKSDPVGYTFGSFGTASSSHIVGQSFARSIGVTKATHVPYKGSAPLLADLLGGQVPFAFVDLSTSIAQIRAGKLRALAVTGPARVAALSGVPTLGDAGYAGYEAPGWAAVFVSSATPRPLVDRIARDVIAATLHPDSRARFDEQTLVPVASTPDEFARQLDTDAAIWAKMIEDAAIEKQ